MGKKQKVLIVHNYYQIPGGEDAVVANEKELLETHGHEVLTYVRHNRELEEASGLKKIQMMLSAIFCLKTYREIRKILKSEKIDIVHVHNTMHLITPSVYYAAVRENIPVVQTIHNFRLICPSAVLFREGKVCEECLSKGFGAAVRHRCYRNSTIETLVCVAGAKFHRWMGIYKKIFYICLTEFNKEKLLQFRQIKAENIFLKPNFSRNEDIPVLPYAKRKNQVIYAGRLDETKGVEDLLEAWKVLGDRGPKLMICGSGPLEEKIRAVQKKEKLEHVIIKGFLPNHEVKKLMAESKALVFPTRWYEGFPMSIVEAFSVGTPVIGSDLGNVGCLIEEGKTGWKFQTGSPESLAECVLKIEDLTEQVCQTFQQKYAQDENYIQLVNIYEHVTENRKTGK